jgi:predicted aconitase with swiveling domain
MQLDKGGYPTRVFSRTTAGNGDTFVLPNSSGDNSGSMVLQAVPDTGAITAIVVSVDISLDGGVTFAEFLAAINLQTGPKQQNIGGLGAGALVRIRSTTFTLGTANRIDIYAVAG